MTTQSLKTISSTEAIKLLQDGIPLIDLNVTGKIVLLNYGKWNKEVHIENCNIENFDGTTIEFEKPVTFLCTRFNNCSLRYAYFIQGLTISNCYFETYLSFEAGEYHDHGFPFLIHDNTFLDFVSFFDFWFKGEISIFNNNFSKGTNLQSKKLFITFEKPTLIKDNSGQTDIEDEFAN